MVVIPHNHALLSDASWHISPRLKGFPGECPPCQHGRTCAIGHGSEAGAIAITAHHQRLPPPTILPTWRASLQDWDSGEPKWASGTGVLQDPISARLLRFDFCESQVSTLVGKRVEGAGEAGRLPRKNDRDNKVGKGWRTVRTTTSYDTQTGPLISHAQFMLPRKAPELRLIYDTR